MKIPEPTKKPNGKWIIQIMLNRKRISRTFDTRREALAWAAEQKTQETQRSSPNTITLSQAIDKFIEDRSESLSPSTIRGYRAIQNNRFQKIMDCSLTDIAPDEWQGIINREARICSPKTLKNAVGFIRTVAATVNYVIPNCRLPQVVQKDHGFFTYEQILPFVKAVTPTQYALPALLALSSMRISEIYALRWEDIPKNPDFIRVAGSTVRDEDNSWVTKSTNKNVTSARNVPVLIPELKAVLERDRKESGPLPTMNQNNLRKGLATVCEKNGLPYVGVHGLRHSFASLAYHLQIPERVAMEIGGWDDPKTMQRIYTHIAQQDITRYQGELSKFYESQK